MVETVRKMPEVARVGMVIKVMVVQVMMEVMTGTSAIVRRRGKRERKERLL